MQVFLMLAGLSLFVIIPLFTAQLIGRMGDDE